MADVPQPDTIRNPLGSPFDEAATPEQCGPGQPGATIFALLKGILLKLDELAQRPDAN